MSLNWSLSYSVKVYRDFENVISMSYSDKNTILVTFLIFYIDTGFSIDYT
nr:MAG TPA: hypothetical protein [Caudoviricetes sp.]